VKEMPIYELTVAKNGPKVKESAEEPEPKLPDDAAPAASPSGPPKLTFDKDGYPELPPGRGPGTIIMNGRARMRAPKQSMAEFATILANYVNRPVTDSTGLKGKYDFAMYWMSDMPMGRGGLIAAPPPEPTASTPSDADSGPTLFSAVQQQLGLNLESKKGQVDILVIDHIEKAPTEN
jgi:uncharacterized protein (TIGR03435 family)